uniref:DUF4350 domain-containing protein n=1 Tax=Eiseniibacteriota bacterium TaxID=2212470 RepID=A0A832I2B5_UNCEI
MPKTSARTRTAVVLAALGLAACANAPAAAQQAPDATFDARVARPARDGRAPRVVVDEAHHHFRTAGGRDRAFADLVAADGGRVAPGTAPFSAAALAGVDVLVISDALGHPEMADPAAERSAFTAAECDAARDGVRAGGARVRIADHAPLGAAARALADRFGVGMRNAYAFDATRAHGGRLGTIAFRPDAGLAERPPIVAGRDSSERLRRVVSFTGQSLAGPPQGTAILALSERAVDPIVGFGQAGPHAPCEQARSAAGHAQAVAFGFGRGRVVVLREAAMLPAQGAGPRRAPFGMNVPGLDNRPFALNEVRWLTRAL